MRKHVGRILYSRLPVTRFFLDLCRAEAGALLCRLATAFLPWRRRKVRHLRELKGCRVNVACGPEALPDHVNLDLFSLGRPDVIAWDCRRRLPFADASVRGIRVEHFLEHLDPREELPQFLVDCYRVLEMGGVLRVIVPDAGRFVSAYCSGDGPSFAELGWPEPFPGDLPTRMDVLNHIFHQWHEHRWGYDEENLRLRLDAAGFRHVARMGFGRSLDGALAQDRAVHAPYSLYMDAVK